MFPSFQFATIYRLCSESKTTLSGPLYRPMAEAVNGSINQIIHPAKTLTLRMRCPPDVGLVFIIPLTAP
jgi:hypothetical protein